jgi:cytochrome c oxidase subunit III
MSETQPNSKTREMDDPLPAAPPIPFTRALTAGQWGMVAFIVSESAFFATLIVVYLTYIGRDRVGPTPKEALSLPLVIGTTICLLSSSLVIHMADRAIERGHPRTFQLWWAGTICLGLAFLAGTLYEWYGLVHRHHLTISRNLFGSTYYTLVGFHGLHVSVGVIVMLAVLGLALAREVTHANRAGVQLVSWYWHFVDGVWIAVFTVVYIVGR